MKHDRTQPVFAGKTIAELEALTADLDRPFVIDQTRPLTPAERRLWERAKRKPGRPKVGKGVRVVSIGIELGLLGRADKLAKKLKVSRARLVSAGLEHVLAATSELPPARKSKTMGAARRVRRKAA